MNDLIESCMGFYTKTIWTRALDAQTVKQSDVSSIPYQFVVSVNMTKIVELEQSILFGKCHSDASVNFLLDQLFSVTLLFVVVADAILLIANVSASAGFHMLEIDAGFD